MQTDKTDGALVVSEIVWQGAVKEATSGDAEETDIKRVGEWKHEDQVMAHALAESLGVDNEWSEQKKHRLNCSPEEIPRTRLMLKYENLTWDSGLYVAIE